jgi:hypothetical protein
MIDSDRGELSDGIKMVEMLNKMFNHPKGELEFKEKPEVVRKRIATLFAVLTSFIIFVYLIYNVLMYQPIWLFVALSVHIICTGGVGFILIMGVPWFKYGNENGKEVIIEYIYRDNRNQWGAEGFMMSALTTVIGLIYALLSRVHK